MIEVKLDNWNFNGDAVLGQRSCQGAGTDSKVSMDHVQGKDVQGKDVQGKEAACQTMPYPRERGFKPHCLLKVGLIIIVIMLLTVCVFASVKWMQLPKSVLAPKEDNQSMTR